MKTHPCERGVRRGAPAERESIWRENLRQQKTQTPGLGDLSFLGCYFFALRFLGLGLGFLTVPEVTLLTIS
jgi:hypothetical protein